MSGYTRKARRRNQKIPHCCKKKMTRKEFYDTQNQQFYFCEICGKEKLIESEDE